MEPCIFATGVIKIKLCQNDRLGFMHEPLKHNFFNWLTEFYEIFSRLIFSKIFCGESAS